MAQTFDTSRVGGGTYELEQDANGNYKLKSVGFAQVNKLNLPDLATSDSPVKKILPVEEEKKIEVADPFKKLGTQNTGGGEGGGQDYSGVMLKTPEVKDAEVRSAGQPMAKERLTESFAGEEKPTQTYAEQLKQSQANVELGLEPQTQYRSDSAKFKERFDPTKIQAAPEKATGLQKVTSKATGLKADIANIVSKSPTVKVITGAAKVLGAFLGAIAPEETESQKHAKKYFNYSQVGAQAQRISGNPANDLYAGANANAREVSNYGKKRIDTITKTISKMTPAQKAKSSLPARLEKFEKQQKEYINDRVSKREDKSGSGKKSGFTNPGAKSYGPHSGGGGGGGGGGCFLKGTLITMLDGTKKPVEQVDLGNEVAIGGKVFATGKFLVKNLHDYKGIKVSGSHMVSENNKWVRVEDSEHGKLLGNEEHIVYVFGSENRRILINDILFTDYFEVNEQDKLMNNEEDFFDNWKLYAKQDSGNNVDIINAS